MASGYAFVTLLTSDSYLQGALTLAAALRDVHPSPPVHPEVDFQTVCLVTPETVDVATIKLLRKAFDVVIGVEIIAQKDNSNLHLLGRPDLNTVLTKLHVFRLTQYRKIIFLDADVLPIRPLSHLFTVPHEFSAVPDVGWPDIFNSGVLVLSPGQEKFDELNALLNSKGTWDGGDQGILNEWRGSDWNRLSFTYNTTPTAAYTYAPAYERYGSQISAIHFIGPNKPWHSAPYRAPFQQSSSQSESQQPAYDYNSLLDRWFDVYDNHYRSQPILPEAGFEIRRYSSVWEGGGGAPPPGNAMGLEDLRRVAIEGTTGLFPDRQAGDGEYRSMPLEGRVDLIRRPTEEPVSATNPTPLPFTELAESPPLPSAEVPPSPHLAPIPLPPTPAPPLLPPSAETVVHQPSPWPTQAGIHQPSPQPTQAGFRQPSPQLTRTGFLQSSPQSIQAGVRQPSPQSGQAGVHQLSPQPGQAGVHQLPPQSAQAGFRQPSPQSAQVGFRQSSPQPAQADIRQPSPTLQPHSQSFLSSSEQQAPYQAPVRPPSPPKVNWNPAIEPPPNNPPPASAFPTDTYFPNVWDRTPSNPHDQVIQHQTTSPSGATQEPAAFFRPPPTPEIPHELRKQGHYRNVTGEDAVTGASPSPDRNKVKTVFPWEEKPRQMPGRVFPDYDAPPPEMFTSPESVPSPSPPPVSPPIQQPSQPVSPPRGLPLSLTYANAWDNVPSIQRYAERLVRPAYPQSLAPAFDSEEWKKVRGGRSWDERSDANSRDGDDEDDGEDEGAEHRRWTEVSDHEGQSSTSSGSYAKARSRRDSSSVSASYITKGKKKEYRVRGVQTTSPEMRSQGVQVNIDSSQKVSSHRHSQDQGGRTPPASTFSRGNGSRKHWIPTISPPSVGVSAGSELPMSTASPTPVRAGIEGLPSTTPTGMRSPREYSFSTPSALPMSLTPPLNQQRVSPPTSESRSVNGSSIASPLSSIGPISPPEGQPLISPVRKGGRVWDPARGVELFKRGSEEVLARFLKMGSWEDENPH